MLTLACIHLFAAQVAAQVPQIPPSAQATAQHEANFDEERKQANDLYVSGKVLEALPLYEDLSRQDRTVAVFAERHGMGLLKKQATMPDGPAKQAAQQQALAEIRRAQSLGDNSPLVQTILSDAAKSPLGAVLSGTALTAGYSYRGTPEAQASMREAEAAFAKNDFATALKAYQRAAELDPKWYDPCLFLGDAYFRIKDWNNAGIWFQKAIEIDPDRDTAYRYWGDTYFRSGDQAKAKAKYEQALVAEPYSRTSWVALQQWATATKTPIVQPLIVRPDFNTPEGKLQVDPELNTETGDGHASWLVYENARVAHGARVLTQIIVPGGTDKDGQIYPSGYRHTLAEENECLNALLLDIHQKLAKGAVTRDKLEPSIKELLHLQKDGMLECWIVLNGYDAGIRYDYPAYRKEHRELLVAYVDRYIVGQQQ